MASSRCSTVRSSTGSGSEAALAPGRPRRRALRGRGSGPGRTATRRRPAAAGSRVAPRRGPSGRWRGVGTRRHSDAPAPPPHCAGRPSPGADRAGSRRRNPSGRRAGRRSSGSSSPLLRREQEHEPHHHGDGGLVELLLVGTSPESSSRPRSRSMRSMRWMSVSTALRTCLPSWSVTSCWSFGALGEERLQRLAHRHAEEAPQPEQRHERLQRERLLEEEVACGT